MVRNADPMQMLFNTTDISLETWVRIILVATSVFILVELEKYLLRKRKTNTA